MLGIFFSNRGDFRIKVGIILQNVGIFEEKFGWGQVGIFDRRGGDFRL